MFIEPENMTQDMVIEILRNKQKLCIQKQRQIREIQEELVHIDRLAETASLSGMGNGGVRVQTVNTSDLTDVLMDMYRRENDMRKALLAEYHAAAGVLDAIRRVWTCFRALPFEEYDILYRLYVKKELWTSVEESYNHRQMVSRRKSGLDFILKLYRSHYLNREIAEIRFVEQKEETKKEQWGRQKGKEITAQGYEQLSFPLESFSGKGKNNGETQ